MTLRTFLVVASLAFTFMGCGSPSSAPPSAPSGSLGKVVSFSLPSDGGNLIAVPTTARTTVLDFWAPTCVPCKKSLPELHAKSSELEAAGAKLVLVAVLSDGESTDDARKTLASWGVTAPFLVDRGGVAQREAGVQALPATLVLDAQGTLKWVAPVGAGASDVVKAVSN